MAEELPETNDPYELLNVTEKTSLRDLKRAYVRKIKIFRPEKYPDEFKRIQEAYENIRDWIKQEEFFGSPDEDAGDTEVNPIQCEFSSDNSSNGPKDLFETVSFKETTASDENELHKQELRSEIENTDLPQEQFHTNLDEIDDAELSAINQELQQSTKDQTAGNDSVHLTSEQIPFDKDFEEAVEEYNQKYESSNSRSLDWWIQALDSYEPVTDDLLMVSDEDLIFDLFEKGKLDWRLLMHQPHTEETLDFMLDFVAFSLVRGDGEKLFREFSSSEFKEKTVLWPDLERLPWRLCAFGIWDYPEESDRLLAQFPPTVESRSEELDYIELNLPVFESFRKAEKKKLLDPHLSKLIRFSYLERAGNIAAEELKDYIKDKDYLPFLKKLDRNYSDLLRQIHYSADYCIGFDTDRIHSLSDEEIEWQEILLKNIYNKVESHWSSNILVSFLIFGAFGSGVSFFFLGWWGFAVFAVYFLIVLILLISPKSWFVYPKYVRPQLIEGAGKGLIPEYIPLWIDERKANDENIASISLLSDDIEDDALLHALASLKRLSVSKKFDDFIDKNFYIEKDIPESLKLLLSSLQKQPDEIKEALRQFYNEKENCFRSIVKLCSKKSPIADWLLFMIDRLNPPDDRLLDELPDEEKKALNKIMMSLEKELDTNRANSISNTVLGLTILSAIPVIIYFGWISAAVMAGLIFVQLIISSKLDEIIYPKIIRSRIAEKVAVMGISPDRILEWVSKKSKFTDNLGRFDDEIESDTSLYIYSSLFRLYNKTVLSPKKMQDKSNA
ncbi:MAG: J domain-containing protein [Spirochaetia bacterium]|nr:J domain-containing protein [Spirochaetia bacterium]